MCRHYLKSIIIIILGDITMKLIWFTQACQTRNSLRYFCSPTHVCKHTIYGASYFPVLIYFKFKMFVKYVFVFLCFTFYLNKDEMCSSEFWICMCLWGKQRNKNTYLNLVFWLSKSRTLWFSPSMSDAEFDLPGLKRLALIQ